MSAEVRHNNVSMHTRRVLSTPLYTPDALGNVVWGQHFWPSNFCSKTGALDRQHLKAFPERLSPADIVEGPVPEEVFRRSRAATRGGPRPAGPAPLASRIAGLEGDSYTV